MISPEVREGDLINKNYLPVGVLVFSNKNHDSYQCVSYNTAARNLFGTIELLNIKWEQFQQLLEIDLNGDEQCELYLKEIGRWVLVSKAEHNEAEFSITATDITTIKHTHHLLEEEVQSLRLAKHDLENFAFIAAHDLKEPARKVVAFAERFLESTKTIVFQTEQLFFLNKAIDGAKRMLTLVDYILDFSRQTQLALDLVTVDVKKLIDVAISDLHMAISHTNAQLFVEEMPTIRGDEIQLIGVFKNLLSNALKFQHGTTVPIIHIRNYLVTAEDIARENLVPSRHYIGIQICDNGIGFDQNEQAKMFAMFGRLRGRSEYKGVGLGLAICERLIRNHKGAIWGVSDGVQGSQFIIALPKDL